MLRAQPLGEMQNQFVVEHNLRTFLEKAVVVRDSGPGRRALPSAHLARSHPCKIDRRPLVQQRLPVGWYPSRRSRYGLTFRMRVRRRQFHTPDHPLLLVIEEPVLARLKAGYDRMPGCRRMLRCVLTRRTVTASDVPTFRTPAEMKPPPSWRCQAFHTPIATRLRSGVDSAQTLFHFRSRSCHDVSGRFTP